MVIHPAPAVALQEQPASAVTVVEDAPPDAVGVAEVGLSESVEHGSGVLGTIATRGPLGLGDGADVGAIFSIFTGVYLAYEALIGAGGLAGKVAGAAGRMILVVGFAAGPIPALPWNLLLLKGASLVGVVWGDFQRREPQANAAMMQALVTWYGQGKIKPVIDRTLPMSELKAAYALMGSRSVRGKLVMVNPG